MCYSSIVTLLLLSAAYRAASLRDLQAVEHGLGDVDLTAASPNVKIGIDLSQTQPMPPNLYGIFFEEVSRRSTLCSLSLKLNANAMKVQGSMWH